MNLKLNVRTVAREDVYKLRLGYLSTLTAWIRITILMRNFSFIQHFSYIQNVQSASCSGPNKRQVN